MYKYPVIGPPQPQQYSPKSYGVPRTRYPPTLFTKRVDSDIMREFVIAFLETYNSYLVALFCELLDPPMEKAESRVVSIYGLSANQKLHIATVTNSMIDCYR